MSREEQIRRIGAAVASELQRRRIEIGLSRNALAQKAGISVQSVSFIENGVNSPSLSTLLRITFALETTLEEVLRTACESSD